MPVPTTREPGHLVQSADINTLAAAINALEISVAGKQDAGTYVSEATLGTAIATRAALSHNHTASAINAGELASARMAAATASARGAVELATNAETLTGTDATRAVTPAGMRSVIQKSGWTVTLTNSGEGQMSYGTGATRTGRFVYDRNTGIVEFVGYVVFGTGVGPGTAPGPLSMSLPPITPTPDLPVQICKVLVMSSALMGGSVGDGTGTGKIEQAQRVERMAVHTNAGNIWQLRGDREWVSGNRIVVQGRYIAA